ncbi:chromosomal replication initiator protein DnaA [Leptospira harrisiae]|uniref:Chromosomal replication initiator protein DnaA n=1 Tax=Leptospira harrisiae TaxID=2023189 RepID=A0A2N0AH07_9LEPT|nr:chromosomal replication initiator protein DnaA [Leptospira harrisiae]PJZ83541.1 chromosomal replication initiation protein DnaA [Leptospira harrisiae]PKA06993.1 chromosomal replication initiation protein DnaA [Leptospira harrisiae]
MDIRWEEILEEISKQIPPKYFSNFIAPLRFDKSENQVVHLTAPSTGIKRHVETKYTTFIEDAVYQVVGDRFRVSILAESETSTQIFKDVIQSKFDESDSDLNPEFIFSNYITSDSNRIAYTAAKSVAEQPGKYNPLYIFGPVGVGKTHLLHAIGNEIKKKDPWKTIRYVNSTSFLNEFIFTVRQNNRESLESFKIRYQSYNVLLFDDIQFLNGGAEKTQEEFFALFNFLYDRKRQIVIASDRPSYELPLHERLKSRFVHGLQADVKSHDLALRIELLRANFSEFNIPASDKLLLWLAERLEGDSRALIGIVNDLVLYKKAYEYFLLTEEKIQEIAEARFLTNKKRIGFNPDMVIDLVCERTNIARKDLIGKSRKADFIPPRHLCMLLLHDVLHVPKAQIGRIFSTTHSTVIHGIDKFKERMKTESQWEDVFHSIKHKISFQ